MKELVYHRMAEIEDRHWWFAGRRAVVGDTLARLGLPAGARILEVGCGTGGNFSLLSRFGDLWALDADSTALGYADRSGLAHVGAGRLPDGLPADLGTFDLVVLLDVLEHLDDDAASLVRVLPLVRPGGRLFVTVPAHPRLWSPHDELHQHRRRYTKRQLLELTEAAGFIVRRLTYFNFLLLPAVLVGRLLQRALKRPPERDLDVPAASVNRVLGAIFASERHLLRYGNLPVGVSLLLVAEPHG